MPESSRRVFATHHAKVTKTIKAPIKYVYEWCTDFGSDDGKFSSSKPRHKVIHVGSDRVVRIIERVTPSESPIVVVELVRLIPPDAWHKDQIGVTDLDSVDYKLARLGPGRTRVTLSLTERWMTRKHPTQSQWVRDANEYWDDLVAALEDDYQKGMPAKGQRPQPKSEKGEIALRVPDKIESPTRELYGSIGKNGDAVRAVRDLRSEGGRS
jgi:hypothetical protein